MRVSCGCLCGLVGLVLCGCFPSVKMGKPIMLEDLARLEVGKTSKAEVRKIFGEPPIVQLGPLEVWIYGHSQMRSGFGSTDVRSLSLQLQFSGDTLHHIGPEDFAK